jgi:hypothetical protein
VSRLFLVAVALGLVSMTQAPAGPRWTEQNSGIAAASDGGATWTLVKENGLSGFRSVVAYVPRKGSRALVAVGPSGADLSTDDGRSWRPIEPAAGGGFHTFSIAPSGRVGWGAGEKGRLARLDGLP